MEENRFDQDFGLDRLLEEGLRAPPEDIVQAVAPWRRAMNRILTGLVLQGLTLNFWNLNYLLPAVGHILLLLGLRALRRENGFFRFWWYAFLFQAGEWAFRIFRLAAPGWREFYQTPPGLVLSGAGLALELVQFLCLWQGLRAVRRQAGLAPGAGSGLALLLFNAGVMLLAATGLEEIGWVFFLPILAIYICIIRGLYKLSRELDEAGYNIQPAPVRIPDGVLALVLAGGLAAGIAAVSLSFSRLPMDWRPVDPAEHSQVLDTKARLQRLGFPEAVLDDLLPEDILACDRALRVVVEESGHSVTVTWDENTPKPLTITHVAVELAGEQEQWRVFHHFSWKTGSRFYGTEAFKLWTPYDYMAEGWSKASDCAGRVLYDRDGSVFWSPYYSLGAETYTTTSMFFGTQTTSDPLASFSFPRNGERCRGYVTYETAEAQDGWVMNAWINYVHCLNPVIYPAMTAREWQMTGAWNGSGQPFFQVQDAIQFYPWTVDEEGVF